MEVESPIHPGTYPSTCGGRVLGMSKTTPLDNSRLALRRHSIISATGPPRSRVTFGITRHSASARGIPFQEVLVFFLEHVTSRLPSRFPGLLSVGAEAAMAGSGGLYQDFLRTDTWGRGALYTSAPFTSYHRPVAPTVRVGQSSQPHPPAASRI